MLVILFWLMFGFGLMDDMLRLCLGNVLVSLILKYVMVEWLNVYMCGLVF
ncbi:hypothetical protein Gotur_027819 [Gossypium turneri]